MTQGGPASAGLQLAADVARARLASSRMKMQLALIVSRCACCFCLCALVANRLMSLSVDFFAEAIAARLGWGPIIHHLDTSNKPPTLIECNCTTASWNVARYANTPSCALNAAAAIAPGLLRWQPIRPIGARVAPAQHRDSTAPIYYPQRQLTASQSAGYWWPTAANSTRTNIYSSPLWDKYEELFARPSEQYLARKSSKYARI